MKTNKTSITKTMSGVVVKKSGKQTVAVLVKRQKKHAKYHKLFWVEKKYLVHDEKEIAVVGQNVLIKEVKPISKNKTWMIVEAVSPDASRAKKDSK